MSSWRVCVRAIQTLEEINRLEMAFDAWLKKRLDADKKKQYQTQLSHLGQLIKNVLQQLRQETTNGIPSDIGDAYRFCRQQEKRLLWVERTLWGFYREKFDQRDQAGLAPVLEAADDVVWSCYKEVCDRGGLKSLPPIPLAYFEPYFSPQALPRDEPPTGWAGDRTGDALLKEYFSRLPIPVVSLPPICVEAPWWLVYLGHETGHHVQYDLGLVASFGNDLRAAGRVSLKPGESSDAAQRWWDWSKEIFADLFSVLVMGSGAVWAIVELVRTRPVELLVRQANYPPPVARLALLAGAADDLALRARTSDDRASQAGSVALQDLPGSVALDEIIPKEAAGWKLDVDYEEEWRREAVVDIEVIDVIRQAGMASTLEGRGPLSKLTGWNGLDFRPEGLVGLWLKAFRKGQLRPQQRSLRAARLITAAALERWRELVAQEQGRVEPGSDLKQAGDRLKTLYLQAIAANRDETTRTDVPQAPLDVETLSTDLSERLLKLDFPEGVWSR